MQRKEVNVLDVLRRAGCSDFIPTLHGVFQRAGTLEELVSAWLGGGGAASGGVRCTESGSALS